MTPFQTIDPNYEARVRSSFSRQRVMETLGASITRIEPGEVEIVLPYREDLTQQHGFLHAGVVATILDSACGYAAFTLMPADAAVLTVEYKINLLSPAAGERLIARGRVIRPGCTISVCQAEGFMAVEPNAKPVAIMTGTIMTVYKEGIEN